ncbi:uncharacterized protein si:ch211-245h14.1 isoform X2 [Scophthalmus maximus]|uniref:uncharacterized protein si:ch211-245h14.1 isoform X2 n=2 Tax=Scophthalmus maximus TaxID=52904 RepID=UPI0015E08B75|nr:uncharacterized protein si:ch211-245h14.1 isoform X2 [Scophthalmus maximus]
MQGEFSTGDYQSITDMPQGMLTASWKRFYVFVGGNTNNAHESFVRRITASGHTEVGSFEECDYCLAFCPIASRVGTDVDYVLRRIPADKPTVLVLMYHTFRGDYVVPESGRLVDARNVGLTVSCLFHEGELLKCSCNDIAWFDIQRFLGLPQGFTGTRGIMTYIKNHPVAVGVFALAVVLVITVIVIATQVTKNKEGE